jgi:Inner membrane protein YgaP-like, transmembrane domain
MKQFVRFMVSPAGRTTRVAGGVVLIVGGLVVGGLAGVVLALIGLVPLLAGSVDVCVFAPPLGYPFSGSRARSIVTPQ